MGHRSISKVVKSYSVNRAPTLNTASSKCYIKDGRCLLTSLGSRGVSTRSDCTLRMYRITTNWCQISLHRCACYLVCASPFWIRKTFSVITSSLDVVWLIATTEVRIWVRTHHWAHEHEMLVCKWSKRYRAVVGVVRTLSVLQDRFDKWCN